MQRLSEAHGRDYMQVIASLREAMAGPLSSDISKTVRTMISKKLAENISPAARDQPKLWPNLARQRY
jgi:hypothetical protein